MKTRTHYNFDIPVNYTGLVEINHRGIYNHKIKYRFNCVNGIKTGLFEAFFENGNRKVRCTYKLVTCGKVMTIGNWTEWYNNGKMKSTGTYDSSGKTGTWQFFKPNGVLLKQENWYGGIKIDTYF